MYPSNCSFNIISGNFVKILPNLNCYGSLGRFSKCQANLLGWGCVWAPQVGKLWNQVFPWRLSTSSSSSSSKTIKTNNRKHYTYLLLIIMIIKIMKIISDFQQISMMRIMKKSSFVMKPPKAPELQLSQWFPEVKAGKKWPRQKVGNISQGSPRGDQTACPLVVGNPLYKKNPKDQPLCLALDFQGFCKICKCRFGTWKSSFSKASVGKKTR